MVDNDKELIAYCGLYCGDCFGYQGKIAELSKDLRKELRAAKFNRLVSGIPFKEFKYYKEAYAVMGALVRLKCKNACRGGGGNPFCAIRKCCIKKGYDGCWQCENFEICKKVADMETAHAGACVKNLKRLKRSGVEAFISGKRDW